MAKRSAEQYRSARRNTCREVLKLHRKSYTSSEGNHVSEGRPTWQFYWQQPIFRNQYK